MSTHPRGWLGYTCPLKVTCFVSILSRPKPAMVGQYVCPRSSQVTPVSPGLLCTLCSLAVPSLSSKSTCLWLLCVCAAHVVHPSTLGGRYLLGGHCEPGVLVRSVMCVLMLLWGLLLCSSVPKMLPLCQSGVSGSVYFLPTCIFSLPPSVPAPSHHTCCIFWVFVGPSLPLGLAVS